MPVIQIVAFQGTGGVVNRNHPAFDQETGLVRAGHVGVQGVIDQKIIGFSPTTTAADQVGGVQALLDRLVNNHEAFPGQFQDDTAVFERAYQLSNVSGRRTTVWQIDVEITEETLESVREWYNKRQTAMYNLPQREPPEFKEGKYNCATFLKQLEIPAPADTGKLTEYIREMIEKGATEWRPENLNR